MPPERALLIGWAGASERHLRGLRAWYVEHEYDPQIILPRAARNMSVRGGWARHGDEVARQLRARSGPLVVHAFSNAGFWTWVATMGAMRASELADVRAVILDSAPGIPERVDRAFLVRFATMAMMPQALALLGRPPALEHALLTPLMRAFFHLWVTARPEVLHEGPDSLAVARAIGEWPHLFLYGGADELVADHLVEAFARSLERRGRQVRLRKWNDSAHVRHFVRYREEYFDELERFLADVPADIVGRTGAARVW
ncbi:MAG: DUF829 domain-containing protein [Sandaracinaceae bacterium]|nr:DUF829 domain-containing protein [Sandaracinaceae bacterium]